MGMCKDEKQNCRGSNYNLNDNLNLNEFCFVSEACRRTASKKQGSIRIICKSCVCLIKEKNRKNTFIDFNLYKICVCC